MSTTDEAIPTSPEPNAGIQSRENPGPTVKIDPACLKDALRMYFQPIKKDDPVVDFYTMYKRETTEFDQEYMNKYNEDLNTTLIFAGLFSAVSSAFVIAFQPGLQQDPSDRSEAYLRAILLSINPSISPDEHPATPSTWNGPPQEIVTTLDLLYASLLMSLLAAFVAMLGKQWLNRYLRRTGGSMIERCGDRQRKFDGIERWPFRAFIGSLPVMLQIALFLLACGLSRYMWSINGSVARVIISFTLLGFLFYVGIVIAGTSSYECPFQTPASTGLRALKGSRIIRRILAAVSSSASALSRITLRQVIQRRARGPPLPIFGAAGGSSPTPRNSPPLLIKVRDLEIIQKQNAANGRCVCWVLRNMTDPEAIDFAICLAGVIRWFDGGLNHDPPFDTIVSFFNACFDSTKQLYPSMRDRAYFSARAILQIHVRARGQPWGRRRYLIPPASSYRARLHADGDLQNLLDIFAALNQEYHLYKLPDMPIHTPAHTSWVSNLFVDVFSVFPGLSLNPLLFGGRFDIDSPGYGYLSAAATNQQVVITNTLLMMDIYFGGRVEGETFWAVDKSDSWDTIFSHLSTTVIKAIGFRGHPSPNTLDILLDFLEAWEKRPDSMVPFAFRWCCAILEEEKTPTPLDTRRLLKSLKIGFRSINLGYEVRESVGPDHASHFERIFRAVSSSRDDEPIADALCAWIAHRDHTSQCPLEILFRKRKEVDGPFSLRLRRVSIRAIELMWEKGFGVSEVPLRCLDVKQDEMTMGRWRWINLISKAVRWSPGVSLPLHHWRLLGDLLREKGELGYFEDPGDVNTMKLLERNGEWEKLEVWMGFMWQSRGRPVVTRVEDVERTTLKLLLRRPSALSRFMGFPMGWEHLHLDRELLELICALAQSATQPLLASAPGPDITQTTRLIEPTPGSSATTHPESAHDSEPGGFREGEGGNGSGCTDSGNEGEGDHPPGSASITVHTAVSPADRGAPPSPRDGGEQLVNCNSEQLRSGVTTTTTGPARAVPNQPPPVEDHTDNSTHHCPLPPSSCIPAPDDREQNTTADDEPVQTDESQKTTREHFEELWLGLGRKEREDLVEAEKGAVLEEMKRKDNCDCRACRGRQGVVERELSEQCDPYRLGRRRCVDNILCMLPQPHGPRPSDGPAELDVNVSRPEPYFPPGSEPRSWNPMITVAQDGTDSKLRAVDPESELGHFSEATRARLERGELLGFGHDVAIPDRSVTAADNPLRANKQGVLEEFIKAMADRRIIFESATTPDTGGRSEDHSYDHYQLRTEMERVCSIFVPRLLLLRLLEIDQETSRILLERQQTYRRWLQEFMDEDEGVVKE